MATPSYHIAAPPDALPEYVGIQAPIMREAHVTFHSFSMRPVAKKKARPKPEDKLSKAQKKRYMVKTLGIYYYLPRFMHPRKKLSAVVAMEASREDDLVLAGATKQRNKMLLVESAAKGHFGTMTGILEMGGLNINDPDEDGELALCAAAAHGQSSAILKVYEYCRPDLLKARDEDGMTPLMSAAEAGQVEAATALLKCGDLLPVRVAHDHLTQMDANGMTARQHAVKKGSSGVVSAIDEAERRTLNRPAKCRHNCGMPITYGEQSMHEKVTCPVVATTCPLCGMTVRRTYFSIHAGYECKMRIRVPSPR